MEWKKNKDREVKNGLHLIFINRKKNGVDIYRDGVDYRS